MTDATASPAAPPAKPLPAPGSLGAWIMAIRPKTLVAGWAPVLVGGTIGLLDVLVFQKVGQAAAPVVPGFFIRWMGALVVAVTIQVATNLVNDAADHERGADSPDRLGPPRAVSLGLLSSRQAKGAAALCLLIAALVGLALVSVTSWWLAIPGLLAIVAAVAYTEGPRPLAYVGLGEAFVFVFFGLVALTGTIAVTVLPAVSGTIQLTYSFFVGPLVWVGIPFGLLAVAILEVNNIRDAPTDRLVGKRTLAVRIGDMWARRLFLACLVTAGAVLAVPLTLDAASATFLGDRLASAAVAIIVVGFAVPPARAVLRGASGRELNPVLGQVARLEAVAALAIAALTIQILLNLGL